LDLKNAPNILRNFALKHRYAIFVLALGLILLTLPSKETKQDNTIDKGDTVTQSFQRLENEALEEILRNIEGAGDVKVLLSIKKGESYYFQEDSTRSAGESGTTQIKTVIVTDAQHNESGLIKQVNPPIYQGAIVVCEGADSPSVKLSIIQAVSKITGLGSDDICVLKMIQTGGS
jgi:stage III sporulation protein AG